ncbi:hypothetical protein [Ideonella sp. YS5]|uniref:hypothetical protein n=1 Tax=Ideonella sp. YS5 TaxID=3453714 RepID=UPI003EEB961D
MDLAVNGTPIAATASRRLARIGLSRSGARSVFLNAPWSLWNEQHSCHSPHHRGSGLSCGCRRRSRRARQQRQPRLDRPRHHHLDHQLDQRDDDRASGKHDDRPELDGHDDLSQHDDFPEHDHVTQLDRLDLRQLHHHDHHDQPEFVIHDDDPEHDEPELQQLFHDPEHEQRHVDEQLVRHERPRRSQRPELMTK